MDQHKGAGHHAVTHAAVHQLFETAGAGGTVLGLTEDKFYKELDKSQAYADRVVGGDTWHPSWMDPNAQRNHSMADPSKTGAENIRDIKTFIAENLYNASRFHETHNYKMEWQCLGAAVHALEDSYSNAHVFRDALHPTDPHAHIEALNNFAPGGHHQTHDSTFDKVPVTSGSLERGTDQAAASAVSELLTHYLNHISDAPGEALTAYSNAVSPFFQGTDVHVFTAKEAADFQAQRLTHYGNEVCRDWHNTSTGANGAGAPSTGQVPIHIDSDPSQLLHGPAADQPPHPGDQSGNSPINLGDTHLGAAPVQTDGNLSTSNSNPTAAVPEHHVNTNDQTPANANFNDYHAGAVHVQPDGSQLTHGADQHASSVPDQSAHPSDQVTATNTNHGENHLAVGDASQLVHATDQATSNPDQATLSSNQAPADPSGGRDVGTHLSGDASHSHHGTPNAASVTEHVTSSANQSPANANFTDATLGATHVQADASQVDHATANHSEPANSTPANANVSDAQHGAAHADFEPSGG